MVFLGALTWSHKDSNFIESYEQSSVLYEPNESIKLGLMGKKHRYVRIKEYFLYYLSPDE